jgi:signal recognition particle GTPase
MFLSAARRHHVAIATVRRSFGVMDNVMGFAGKQMEKKRDASFADMIELMMNSPKWTLRHVQGTLDKQLKSWTMYVPGVKSQDQTKAVQKFKDILDKMSDQELDHPETINGPVRDRIALTAGVSIDEVNKLLLAHKQGLITQKWLLMK